MIIGIVGTLGAGKGTVVEYLKDKGFAHYSASGKLRDILESRGVTVNREAYSTLADEIRIADPQGLMQLLWADYTTEQPANAIIEALHDMAEAEFIQQNGGVVLGVDAPLALRYERIHVRGSEKDDVSFAEFKAIATHEEDGGGTHNIRAAMKQADMVISNEGSLPELHTKIEAFLAQNQVA